MSLRIGVVGCGVAGLAAATLLARRGASVTLLERAAEPGPVGAGFLLQPSGQAVLASMGLLEGVERRAARLSGLRVVDAGGQLLLALSPRRAGGEPATALGVKRGVLFDALLRSALEAGVLLEANCEIASFVETTDGVRLIAADLTRRRPAGLLGPFDLVLAADGARSSLREIVSPGSSVRADPYGAAWAVAEVDCGLDHLLQATDGTTRLTGLLPLGAGSGDRMLTNFFWGLRLDTWERTKRAGFASFREQVLGLLPGAEPVVTELGERGGFETFTIAGYRHARPYTPFRGRTLLIGDAAHATTPHLGQGANLALVDAFELAETLAATKGDVARALPRFTRRRRSQVRYFVQLSRLTSPFFQSDHTSLGRLRDFGLRAAGRLGLVRRIMEKSLGGERRGWWG